MSEAAPAVNELHRYLLREGALNVHPDFNIAGEGQQDIVFIGSRYLLTANDQDFRNHQAMLRLAEQPILEFSEDMSALNPNVAVVTVPRDALTLAQVAVSTEAKGISNEIVFGLFGNALGEIAQRTKALPAPVELDLQRIIYSRMQDAIILPPVMEFEPHSPEASYAVDSAVNDQLSPRYKIFGAGAMYGAFLVGKNK